MSSLRQRADAKFNDGGAATYNAANSTGTELEFDYTPGAGDQTSNLEITQVNGVQTVQAPGGAASTFQCWTISQRTCRSIRRWS